MNRAIPVGLGLLWLTIGATCAGSLGDEPSDAASAVIEHLNSETIELYGTGQYREGTARAQQALAKADESLGPEHPDTLISVNNLAALRRLQGRYREAEPLYKCTGSA